MLWLISASGTSLASVCESESVCMCVRVYGCVCLWHFLNIASGAAAAAADKRACVVGVLAKWVFTAG